MTIGAVCELLQQDFPTISISKIRYLEDQRLITPQRTAGGYRLYSPLEVERLRTILRLQRDEFLPLRVIRQELESSTSGAFSVANQAKQLKRAQLSEPAPTRRYSARGDRGQHRGADAALLRALEEFGLLGGQPSARATTRPTARWSRPPSSWPPTAWRRATCASSGWRPSARPACSSSCSAPACARKNPERRREALDALESLAALVVPHAPPDADLGAAPDRRAREPRPGAARARPSTSTGDPARSRTTRRRGSSSTT